MTITVYSNNLVSLDGTYVGRIDRDSYQSPIGKRGKTTFFTGEPGTYDKPHAIDAALYIGSGSNWKINPAFEDAVREVLA